MSSPESDRLLELASRLLAMDGVFRGLQRALRKSHEARRAVDRNVGRVLSGLNLASYQDLERLFDHIRELELEITSLSGRLERMAHALESNGNPHHCPHQKPDGMTGE